MSNQDKNLFGGGNPHGLYTPMSDIEQEILDDLITSGALRLEIDGWGFINELPQVTFGDLRLSIPFRLLFDRPEFPVPLYHLDLRLKTHSGMQLYAERMKTLYAGKPVLVSAGVQLDLVWDIAIAQMHPKVVKALKPHHFGLTSANFDRDTKEATVVGNRRLGQKKKRVLHELRQAEKASREDDAAQLLKAQRLEKKDRVG